MPRFQKHTRLRSRPWKPDLACLIAFEEILLPTLLMGDGSGTIAPSGVAPEAMRPFDRPDPALLAVSKSRPPINPRYGGREVFLPNEFSNRSNHTMQSQSLGIFETQGLTAILNATDAMLKAADVGDEFDSWRCRSSDGGCRASPRCGGPICRTSNISPG